MVGDVIAIATHADSVVNQRRVSCTPPEGEHEVFKIVKSDQLLQPVLPIGDFGRACFVTQQSSTESCVIWKTGTSQNQVSEQPRDRFSFTEALSGLLHVAT